MRSVAVVRYAAGMPRYNYAAQELVCKLVYWGPAGGGKSQHLAWLAANAPPASRGRLVQLAAETEHALLFEFLPLALGALGPLATRWHVYTVPGQPGHGAVRQAVLRGADGVAFVADARPARRADNVAALQELRTTAKFLPPALLVVNHTDAVDAQTPGEVAAGLGWLEGPVCGSSAVRGEGVAAAVRTLAREVLADCARHQEKIVRLAPA